MSKDDVMGKIDEALPPLIEVDHENGEPYDNDNAGCWITLIMFIIMILALAFAIVKIAPGIDQWIEKRIEKDAEATQVVDAGSNPDEWCRQSGYVKNGNISTEIAQVNAEACLPYCGEPSMDQCSQLYDVAFVEGHDPGAWHEYIRWADATTNDMYKVVSRIELLADLYYENTDQSVLMGESWLDDEQVFRIVKDIKEDVLNIQDQTMSVWPPSPYNSSNPLLDSHARIVNASSELIRAGYWLVLFENFPANQRIAHMNNNALDALIEIERAQTGLEIARGME